MKTLPAIVISLVLSSSGTALAQVAPPGTNLLAESNAIEVRAQLWALLNQYPPTVAHVLQTDPALLTNKEYLDPYPALAAYINKHPEITHNAVFFLGTGRGPDRLGPVLVERNPNSGREGVWDAAIALVLITIVGGITWIVRSLIDYRRWTRMLKTQTDVHSRLMDRLTSSEDLLAYIQSPAGKRFLEFAPVSTGSSTTGTTQGRILWSVQAGLVLGLAGVGLHYSSGYINAEASQPFFVLGVLLIAIGAGFILSAFASYLIARNMGLVQGTSVTPPT
jgi:hypothetical protein